MRLERLEIFGFKSFADRTIVEFNPGITAVVGPNGCGKTNITDAIRWALGEQRPTALRGSSMQEVIFNGSRERKPLGMAEVTLTFGNALGLIPVEYSEVSITRRVFRDGESEYFMNRAPCHLKDIRDLFLGTGVGSSAYSLIEQRMVDAILSDRAEERRFLFEEASGVTRYKLRRKATLRKLEATESDLRRLEDVLGEVRKTTSSLRRQVGRARRFELLQREELRLGVALAAAELAELASREGPLRETIRALEAELAGGASAAVALEADLARVERELAAQRADERGLRQGVERAAAELEARARERMIADEGRRQAVAEAERLAREIGDHEAQARALAGRRTDMAAGLARAAGEAAEARREAAARTAAVEELSARFSAARAAYLEARERRERVAEARLDLRGELARAMAEQASAAARRAELEGSLAAAREAAGAVGPAATAELQLDLSPAPPPAVVDAPAGAGAGAELAAERALEERVHLLHAALVAARQELGRRREARLDLEREHAAAKAELDELAARRRELAARVETLEELEGGFPGFGEGARRALEAREAIAPGLRGPLALEVEVRDPRHAAAVEAYLDLYLDALLTEERGEARAVLEFWRERNHCGAVWPLGEAGQSEPPELDPAARARLLCRGTEAAALKGDLDRYRAVLFGRLLLAEDLEAATELRRALNGNGAAGAYVVAALSGEILEPSGMVRLPQRRAETNPGSRFHQVQSLKARSEELELEVQRLETRCGHTRARLDVALFEERAADERAAARAAVLERAERELERLRGARQAALSRLAELERELAGLDERLARESERAHAAGELAAAEERRLAEAEADQTAREADLEAVRLEREAAVRELGVAELTAQGREAALATLEREARYLGEGAEEQERLARDKQAELDRQRERAVRLEGEAARHAAAVEEERARLNDLRRSHAALEARIQSLEAERAARDAEARAARTEHQEASQRLHQEEMRLAELIHRRETIHTVVETEFGGTLESLQARLSAGRAAAADVEPAEPWRHESGSGLEAPSVAKPDGAAGSETPGWAGIAEEGDAGHLASTADGLAEANLEMLRERLRAVRDRKAALGPVNLLALEEFGTEQERLTFLEVQYEDLVRARDGLRAAIRKINTTARELFSETFERVRENFQVTFGTLFEGGTAEISLLDPADPLESDIEISASPRGKRVQAVNLLSGGERALTALSLLFAIYLVKPSPFCILDEVDAPLDDANIGRFLRMLQEFRDRTQFIVVTHNKRTMEASDFLYGVTMEEAGVSTLVSVDFERRHTFDYEAISFRREGAAVGD